MNLKGSAGGKAIAIKLREEALDRYYTNPSYCTNCNTIIKVKENEKVQTARRKKFCCSSCSANYNNKLRKVKPKERCPICNTEIERLSLTCKKHRGLLSDSSNLYVFNKTKGQFKTEKRGYQNWRSLITKMAKRVYLSNNLPLSCVVCGYDSTFDVCHIKAVSDFDDETIIGEINNVSNLIALCPNHHWELDHGVLDINDIAYYGSGHPLRLII
jgi:hypothetical protein